ncbi:MAG: hypothetical protein HDT16_01510 [Oscillibacter sp.]|nr:hypothetical protein [Oscillibacter sp.]
MSLELALQKISAQQPKERTPVWMVGEQLKDILRAEPSLAELVAQDLDVKEMSLAACEKKIKAFADLHKTGNFACVIPSEAEGIIREFYGLPSGPAGGEPGAEGPAQGSGPEPAAKPVLRVEDFF